MKSSFGTVLVPVTIDPGRLLAARSTRPRSAGKPPWVAAGPITVLVGLREKLHHTHVLVVRCDTGGQGHAGRVQAASYLVQRTGCLQAVRDGCMCSAPVSSLLNVKAKAHCLAKSWCGALSSPFKPFQGRMVWYRAKVWYCRAMSRRSCAGHHCRGSMSASHGAVCWLSGTPGRDEGLRRVYQRRCARLA